MQTFPTQKHLFMKTLKLMALIAVSSAGLFSGMRVLSSNHEGRQSTLVLLNVEAISDAEQEIICRWELKTDAFGCIYHECTPKGNGFICRCGDKVPY